jgi:hypothetical protein
MAARLNHKGFEHARSLVELGHVERDVSADWSSHRPSETDEAALIRHHGIDEYGKWHLGVEPGDDDDKSHYKFPFGDFKTVHRCAVQVAQSLAGECRHADIERAARELLELIDAGSSSVED